MSGPYNIPDSYSQFERLGHPGKYTSALTYASGQLDLTGSNYGYGSIIVKTHGNATASLSGGGQIILSDLTAGVIYDLSMAKISGGTGAVVYVLKRQGI
jgi:hypothetical protein